MNANATNVHEKLCKMLLHYRIASHATTKKSSAELFFGRKLRTRLDLLFPLQEKDEDLVSYQCDRSFKIGERVSCRNYVGKVKWKFGKSRNAVENYIT